MAFCRDVRIRRGQRNQHHVRVLRDELLEDADDIAEIAVLDLWRLGEGQEGVERLLPQLPLLFFHLAVCIAKFAVFGLIPFPFCRPKLLVAAPFSGRG